MPSSPKMFIFLFLSANMVFSGKALEEASGLEEDSAATDNNFKGERYVLLVVLDLLWDLAMVLGALLLVLVLMFMVLFMFGMVLEGFMILRSSFF